jgi:deoxyhypusine synthase
MSYPQPLDFKGLETYSLYERESKVSVSDFAKPAAAGFSFSAFMDSLPDQLAASDLKKVAGAVCDAVNGNKRVLLCMGAHVIKTGLNPVLAGLMEAGVISGIAVNGACIIHDSETAMAGKTSEDVAAVLGQGRFGAARETGEFLNSAIKKAAETGRGLGRQVGEELLAAGFPYNEYSLLATAARLGIPVTVHVAVGTDIIHIHPGADGAAIGKATFDDFRIFCSLVSGLEEGVLLHVGSAVLLPEVFLKALTLVRNLGFPVKKFVTANFDFIRQYRPLTNVVSRPTLEGGTGYNITGHHEIMIPLLAFAIMEGLEGRA